MSQSLVGPVPQNDDGRLLEQRARLQQGPDQRGVHRAGRAVSAHGGLQLRGGQERVRQCGGPALVDRCHDQVFFHQQGGNLTDAMSLHFSGLLLKIFFFSCEKRVYGVNSAYENKRKLYAYFPNSKVVKSNIAKVQRKSKEN